MVRERDHRWKPARWNVAFEPAGAEIDHRYRIQPGARNIESRFIGGHRHPERQYAAQLLQTRHGQRDLRQDGAAGESMIEMVSLVALATYTRSRPATSAPGLAPPTVVMSSRSTPTR